MRSKEGIIIVVTRPRESIRIKYVEDDTASVYELILLLKWDSYHGYDRKDLSH